MTPTGPDGEWIKDEALMAENRRLRVERRVKRMRAEAVDRAKAKIAVPHVGLAAYFTVPVARVIAGRLSGWMTSSATW
jgi:hypothetical protein